MAQPNTFESVVTAFSHWRETRTSSKETIPDILRHQAVELLNRYKKSQVISALKINHSTLKRWQQNAQAENTPFVSLTSEPSGMVDTLTSLFSSASNPTEIQTSSELKIMLRNAVGADMCITGHVAPDQLHSLVDSFVGFQGGKS